MIVTVKYLSLFWLIPSLFFCIFMYIVANDSCKIHFSKCNVSGVVQGVNTWSNLCQ